MIKAKRGDFVTATVDLPGRFPIRQGILDGDSLIGESGEVYEIVDVHNVIEDINLMANTLEWVLAWRKENL